MATKKIPTKIASKAAVIIGTGARATGGQGKGKTAPPGPKTPPGGGSGKPAPAGGKSGFSRADHVQDGLEALAQRIRIRDQATAKKLEPFLESLAKAYQHLLAKT